MRYRGRLAPSPTGHLHLGHARTFWKASERARLADGDLILRIEDLDFSRSRPEFVSAIYEDLRWFGFSWGEGPDVGGPFQPYTQSERLEIYRERFKDLRERGIIYPCVCSRRDVLRSLSAPHQGEEEPIYPGNCRPMSGSPDDWVQAAARTGKPISWRFRVPDGKTLSFQDAAMGPQSFVAGKDFGDFLVWRHDDIPSYQLAVVVDDIAMQITEVVRGADLLLSTARQLLLYESVKATPPAFYHCELMTDEHGVRLAKRHESLSLRALRQSGVSPETIRARWGSQG